MEVFGIAEAVTGAAAVAGAPGIGVPRAAVTGDGAAEFAGAMPVDEAAAGDDVPALPVFAAPLAAAEGGVISDWFCAARAASATEMVADSAGPASPGGRPGIIHKPRSMTPTPTITPISRRCNCSSIQSSQCRRHGQK